MTEDEAKAAPCVAPNAENVGQSTMLDGRIVYRCRGGTCMAWRWNYYESTLGGDPATQIYRAYSETDGFCGLVGKP